MDKKIVIYIKCIIVILIFITSCTFDDNRINFNWIYDAGEAIITSPAIDSNDNIIFVDIKGNVYKIDKDGNLIWKRELNDKVLISPIIDKNENILITSINSHIYLISSEGNLIWQNVGLNDRVSFSPFIKDNFIFILSCNNIIYKFDYNNGDLINSKDLTSYLEPDTSDLITNFTITSNMIQIYIKNKKIIFLDFNFNQQFIISNIESLYDFNAISNNNKIIFPYSLGPNYTLDPHSGLKIIYEDGSIDTIEFKGLKINDFFSLNLNESFLYFDKDFNVYVVLLNDSQLYCFLYDNSGNKIKTIKKTIKYFKLSYGLITSNKNLYFFIFDDHKEVFSLINIDISENRINKLFTINETIYAPPTILSDGIFIFTTVNGKVYSYKVNDAGINETDIWPKYRKNLKNSGF